MTINYESRVDRNNKSYYLDETDKKFKIIIYKNKTMLGKIHNKIILELKKINK